MVRHMLFKAFRAVRIIVVAVFAGNDVRARDDVSDEYQLRDVRVWMDAVRVGSHGVFLLMDC